MYDIPLEALDDLLGMYRSSEVRHELIDKHMLIISGAVRMMRHTDAFVDDPANCGRTDFAQGLSDAAVGMRVTDTVADAGEEIAAPGRRRGSPCGAGQRE
jgi:hypothetical protein